jgi:hypothetical protein
LTAAANLDDDGDDAAGRARRPGGGEAKTSPETVTVRLAAASPAKARNKT